MSDIMGFGEWLPQQDIPLTAPCQTWGELLRDNAVHLLDNGELDALRAWLLQTIEEYGAAQLPSEEVRADDLEVDG